MSTNQSIDRNGLCPHCNISWAGRDIYETLSMMDIHSASKSASEVSKLATEFGWSPDNQKRFSKVTVYEIFTDTTRQIFYQCPKCLHTYDADTGEHFNSIHEARSKNKAEIVF